MKTIKTVLLSLVFSVASTFASPYVTVYGKSSSGVYIPPTEPMNIAPSNIAASYQGRLYDSYGFIQSGTYYQTQPQQGPTWNDVIQTFQQWPR